ncbi:MAG: VTT domain-containing protein, partial [Syntrophomonadaceae bacterium]
LILFLLFLIPGLPKDVLTYAAGATPIDPLQFLLTATVARVPGILLSAYIGSNLYQQDYTAVAVASVATVLLFGLGVWAQGRLSRETA